MNKTDVERSALSRLKVTSQRAFTLIELTVVIIIFAVIATLIGLRFGSFSFFNEESTLRKIVETVTFLHYQALSDQSMYQIEIDLNENSYQIGQLIELGTPDPQLASLFSDAGPLGLELAYKLNPSVSTDQLFSPPQGFPSLAHPVMLPPGMTFKDVATMRGVVYPSTQASGESQLSEDNGKAYIRFSPRGFSEFAVIHIALESGKDVTILINPFTGEAQIIRGYKEFEWSYGRNKDQKSEGSIRGFN